MLEISDDKVCYIIVKALEFDVKVQPLISDPGSNPADDKGTAILEDRVGDRLIRNCEPSSMTSMKVRLVNWSLSCGSVAVLIHARNGRRR